MASTQIATKTDFIEFLNKHIKDDQIIVITHQKTGQVAFSKKLNSKNVTFAFADDAFAKQGCIGDIAYGLMPVFAFCICAEKQVAPDIIDRIKQPKEPV